jgi:mono/diheme cytochrome c family protein
MIFARLGPNGRLVFLGLCAALIIALFFFLWMISGPGPMSFARGHRVSLAKYTVANPTGVPGALAQADVIARGKYLATAADCASCHTAPGGKPFAGGFAFPLPFGTLYAPNITPDQQTGIGAWSDTDFLRAVHKGMSRDGTRLYPAFPYAAYTYLTDEDVLAIKAYLFSLEPIANIPPKSQLVFPFNQRWLMAIWSLFFNPSERFHPNIDRSPDWNRGAYLVEALAHCGECHTPRNLMQAPDNRRKFGGAVTAGWRAYNITSSGASGIASWSDAALAHYIALGHADGHGTATGPMGEAIDLSLSHLAPEDIHAIVVYLRSVPAVSTRKLPAPSMNPVQVAAQRDFPGIDPRGRRIFEGACASCHGWNGAGALTPYATLLGTRSVYDSTGINVAQIIISGANRRALGHTAFMPAFGNAYSDIEIAAIANYVTAHFGGSPAKLNAKDVASLRKQTAR